MLASIRAWNSATRSLEVPLGISRDEAERRAQGIAETIVCRGACLAPLALSDEVPDVLHALCQALSRRESWSTEDGGALDELYKVIVGLSWPDDELDEKAGLLAQITQLAWSRSLGRGDRSTTFQWEEESVKHLLAQEGVRQLVRVPSRNWSSTVCERFLSDQTVLLGLCMWVRREPDSNPRTALELASLIYDWLSSRGGTSECPDEEAYLLTELAVSASHGARSCGRYANSRVWIARAEKWYSSSKDPLVSWARVEYSRLALWCENRRYGAVVSRVPDLIQKFAELGLRANVAKSKFLLAVAHKELNCDAEALETLLALESDSGVLRQPWLHGLVLVSLAELANRGGCPDAALRLVQKAEVLLRGVGMPHVLAHCCGVTAEILRDQGNLSAAAECYGRAIEIYAAAEMTAIVAYLRIVLAETLVAIGRDDEGIEEILKALPTIERENLVREGIAALALLKTSVSRRKLDSEALKALRDSLDRSRREAEP